MITERLNSTEILKDAATSVCLEFLDSHIPIVVGCRLWYYTPIRIFVLRLLENTIQILESLLVSIKKKTNSPTSCTS